MELVDHQNARLWTNTYGLCHDWLRMDCWISASVFSVSRWHWYSTLGSKFWNLNVQPASTKTCADKIQRYAKKITQNLHNGMSSLNPWGGQSPSLDHSSQMSVTNTLLCWQTPQHSSSAVEHHSLHVVLQWWKGPHRCTSSHSVGASGSRTSEHAPICPTQAAG